MDSAPAVSLFHTNEQYNLLGVFTGFSLKIILIVLNHLSGLRR